VNLASISGSPRVFDRLVTLFVVAVFFAAMSSPFLSGWRGADLDRSISKDEYDDFDAVLVASSTSTEHRIRQDKLKPT